MKRDEMADFYTGLEVLKNGMAYDKRCAFRKMRFDRPQILVFTNVLPDFGLCSLDRWQVYSMQEDKTMVDQTHEFIEQWREQRRRFARRAERKRARAEQSDEDSAAARSHTPSAASPSTCAGGRGRRCEPGDRAAR
jgi:hypothetical protein